MIHVLKTPGGREIKVDAQAQVWVDNRMVSTTSFDDDGLEDTVFLPRDSRGFIGLVVKLLHQGFDVTGVGRWTYSKLGSKLVFPSASVMPSAGSFGNALLGGEFKAATNAADPSVALLFSLAWGDGKSDAIGRTLGADDADESMDFSVKVNALYEPKVIVGRAWAKRQVEFGPFVTGRSDRLEKGDLRLQMKEWFHNLNADTQNLLENAIVPNDMPAEQPILIEGYTSSLGPQSYNWGLGWDRAQAVLQALRMVSGNNGIDRLCKTPTRGEAPRPTDVRREENNNPQWRKVVVTYWDR